MFKLGVTKQNIKRDSLRKQNKTNQTSTTKTAKTPQISRRKRFRDFSDSLATKLLFFCPQERKNCVLIVDEKESADYSDGSRICNLRSGLDRRRDY